MQAERWLGGIECHRWSDFSSCEIGRVAAGWQADLPEMDANLVGASGFWTGFEERGAVRVATDHAKVGAGGQTVVHVHAAGANGSGLAADRRCAGKHVLCRVALRSDKINFFRPFPGELRMHEL